MIRKKFRIDLQTLSPLLLSDKPIGEKSSIYQSKSYITGSSLRGAFIDLWRRSKELGKEEVTVEVEKFFLSDGIVFENAYFKNGLPLPNTAQTCKQFPGFFYEEGAHGVKDNLLSQYNNTDNFDSENILCAEGSCESIMKPFDGFVSEKYNPQTLDVESYTLEKVSFMEAGHVAIDPDTKTKIKSELYFESAIAIGNTFQGIIHVPPHIESEVLSLKGKTLRIGSKRTSGYGMVEISDITLWDSKVASDNFEELTVPSLQERMVLFQKAAERIGINKAIFSLTLLSDMVIRDSYFRFHNKLTPAILSEITGCSFDECDLIHTSVQTQRISGWNQMWRTESEEILVIKSGSTFLYEMKNGEANQWISKLANIENCGLGERIHEGFGQVVVCHPFHRKVEAV